MIVLFEINSPSEAVNCLSVALQDHESVAVFEVTLVKQLCFEACHPFFHFKCLVLCLFETVFALFELFLPFYAEHQAFGVKYPKGC